MTIEEKQKLRERALAIAHQAERDEEFAARLRSSPVEVLTEYGIAQHTAEHMLAPEFCVDTTCWTSGCPASCVVTVVIRE